MAKMIPESLVAGTPGSERRLYESFRNELPDAWTVIHGQRFLLPERGARSQEGELDFLILDPERGGLGLEVKGGRVKRGVKGWSSVDRRGQEHAIKDPGKQAQNAIHALRRYLESSPLFGGEGHSCSFIWGVALPDVSCDGDLGSDLPREAILDSFDLSQPWAALERMFRARGLKRGPKLARKGMTALRRAFFMRHPSPARLALFVHEGNRELRRLTEEQREKMDFIEGERRAMIDGSAGTGKTVLAAETARRRAAAGDRVLLLCYNRPLARYLREHANGYAAETFHRFCSRMAERADIPFVPDGSAEFWDEEAPTILMDALGASPDERYDSIVVDEGQDFRPDWWECLEFALRDDDSRLCAFRDPNQILSPRGLPTDRPAAAPGVASPVFPRHAYPLRTNCRNTEAIARYAERFLEREPILKLGAPPGRPVRSVKCGDNRGLITRIGAQLERLVDEEGLDLNEIGVISTRAIQDFPFEGNRKAARFSLLPCDDPRVGSERCVAFDTVKRWKGLEREVLLFLDFGAAGDPVTPRERYVAASRAKLVLIEFRVG